MKALSTPIRDADYLPPAELATIQAMYWERQFSYVERRSPFYQELWRGAKPDPRLEAIADLPFTDKAVLRADQEANPPFGRYLAANSDEIIRVHRTSGTTGQAMNLALSAADAVWTATVAGRAQSASGLGPGHRVIHCLNYQLWMGGLTDHLGLEATGAAVIPFGVASTEKLIDTILDLNITAISCTPSYPAVLEQVFKDTRPELSPRDLGLKLGLFGGEAGLDDPAFRERLEAVWGFKVRNSNYGVTDILCNFAGQCGESTDLHFVGADGLFAELATPDGDMARPWREGESGELVLTHLAKDCQPLVRFRTGDIVTITGTDACRCGRTATRFRVVGRSDDMVVVRGINVFPTMVAAVINGFAELSGEYRIVLRGPGPYHELPLEVELSEISEPGERLADEVSGEIKRELGVSATVRLLAHADLPRTAGKTKRVLREPREEPL